MRNLQSTALAIGMLGLVALASASCASASSDQLQIRIRNDSSVAIKGFWLGTGSGAGGPRSRAYGDIAAGETTRYRSVRPQFGAYSNWNLVTTDGVRYLGVFPKEQFGADRLDPGYYTFVFRIVDGGSLLDVIRDAPPD